MPTAVKRGYRDPHGSMAAYFEMLLRFCAVDNLLGHEECAIGFEKITCMSSFRQVAKSEWEPELDLWVNLSEFRNVSSGDSG